MSYMWPFCLFIVGHLHVLYNGLEEACKSLDISLVVFNAVRSLLNFLSDSEYRKKFRHCCMGGKPGSDLFLRFPKMHIDWRWETLGPALLSLLKVLPNLYAHFDLGLMSSSDDKKVKSVVSKTLREAKDALENPYLMILCVIFVLHAAVVGKYAQELEICCCHATIWRQKKSFKRRVQELYAATNYDTCVWKGRRVAWWVAQGMRAFFNELRHATSPQFEQLVAALPLQQKAKVLAWRDQLRRKLVEIYTEKFWFWGHIPWKLLGVFYCCQGGSLERSKTILLECIREYETAVLEFGIPALHRVAVKLLDPNGVVGRELRAFLVQDLPLESFYHAYVALMEYAMVSLVERRVESIHAIVQRLGRCMTNITVPFICAKMREQYLVDLLKSSNGFFQLCLDSFRKRTLLDEVLKLRFSVHELSGKAVAEKIRLVYQCNLDSEFVDLALPRQEVKQWGDTVALFLPRPRDVPERCRQCVLYFQSLLTEGCYSLPTGLFDAWAELPAGSVADSEGGDFVGTCLRAIDVDHPEFDFAAAPPSFFRVVNANPESRFSFDVPHVVRAKHRIVVTSFVVLNQSLQKRRFIVQENTDPGSHLTLDVAWLVGHAEEALGGLFRWVPTTRASTIPAPSLAVEDGSVDFLVPPVLQVGPSQSASSTAMVPFVNSPHAPALSGDASLALCQLGDHRSTHTAFERLHGVNVDSLNELRDSGLVCLDNDSFGSLRVSLVHENIVYGSIYCMGDPVHAFRSLNCGNPLKCTKFDIIIRLHQEGWVVCSDVRAPFSIESDRQYSGDIGRPLAYFVALLEHSSIFAKGITTIDHFRPDGYYRALLLLPRAKLMSMPSLLLADHAFFMDALKDMGPAGHEVNTDEVVGGGSLVAIADRLEQSLVSVIPPVLEPAAWTRCVVTGPAGRSHKVWFDDCTHSVGAPRRGWTVCRRHSCIKYCRSFGEYRQY